MTQASKGSSPSLKRSGERGIEGGICKDGTGKREEEKGVGKSSVTSGHVEGVPRTKV